MSGWSRRLKKVTLARNSIPSLDNSVGAEASAVACRGVNLKRDSPILIEVTPLDYVPKRTA